MGSRLGRTLVQDDKIVMSHNVIGPSMDRRYIDKTEVSSGTLVDKTDETDVTDNSDETGETPPATDDAPAFPLLLVLGLDIFLLLCGNEGSLSYV